MEVIFVARITIEDCLKRVTNRFLLVDYLVSSPKNEDIVVALREVAAGKIMTAESDEEEDKEADINT
jgi:DNA-directed RNA polymerase subunit omega